MTTTATTRRGRPEIGDKIGVRLDTDLLARLDAYAADNGMKRPAAMRELLERGLTTEQPAEPPVTPQGDTTPAPASATTADRIIAAYPELTTNPGDFVGLHQLRTHLADIPRADIDTALADLFYANRISLISEVNQKTLTDDDHAAALHIVMDNKHLYQVR